MGREKYAYNPHTLRYEKVKETTKQKLFKVFGVVLVLLVVTGGAYWIAKGGPDTRSAQERELAEMKRRYAEMNSELEVMNEALENLHQRDAAIYRQVLELEPTDDDIWMGGKGGSDKYADLRNMTDEELLVETTKRISDMRYRLSLMASSQDEVLQTANAKEAELLAIPSIRPIRKLDRKLEYLSGFGYRKHPIFKVLKMHTGIDFGAPKGTPIYATGNGKVARVEIKKTGYGKNVVIDHGFGYQTLYAHMSTIDVKVGQVVDRGTIIGRVGSTGTSTAPHLHYEVIYKNQKVNPLPFCLDDLSPQEYKDFVDAASLSNQALSIGE